MKVHDSRKLFHLHRDVLFRLARRTWPAKSQNRDYSSEEKNSNQTDAYYLLTLFHNVICAPPGKHGDERCSPLRWVLTAGLCKVLCNEL